MHLHTLYMYYSVCVYISSPPDCNEPSLSYFDAHGNYYAKNDPESIQDTWLQEVDWSKVRGQFYWQ